ncbi:MAG: phosphatidate cytidylyltransferase [Deltaproteobacteria bacterium]|nr:phosphatidate cytidylyltransferase [Deltaproteobacteria bacterium]
MDATLTRRVITAVIGVVLILALIIYGQNWGTPLLALVCCFGALWEYFVMLFAFPEQMFQKGVGIILGFALASLIIFRASFLYEGISLFFISLFIFYLVLAHFSQNRLSQLFSELAFTLSGVFYISFLFSFWPKVRELEQGSYWIFLVFLIPWLSDTAAYFIGKNLGRQKLSPLVSPHKTVEGAIGGILGATLGVLLYKFLIFSDLSFMSCIFLGIGGSIMSQLGDLYESLIKRALHVKDSGVVIPGHGGILDRFDSVLFCGPFIYFYARFLS